MAPNQHIISIWQPYPIFILLLPADLARPQSIPAQIKGGRSEGAFTRGLVALRSKRPGAQKK